MHDVAIEKRLFIVGCSRSGTTLLQVSVASHPRIQSFPETFVFQQSTGDVPRFLPWLGVATGNEYKAFRKLLKVVERPDLHHVLPKQPFCYPTAAHSYVRVFDRIAEEQGKDCWLEKSPMHVHYISLIQRYVPRVHFIHILRDGRDVVASICDRSRTYKGRFNEQEKPAFGIRRWNHAIKASRVYFGRPGHSFVLYDQLVLHPTRVMKRLSREMGLSYHGKMATGDQQTAQDIIPEQSEWIQGATEPPQQKESKFEKIFDEVERRRITDQLELGIYETLKTYILDNSFSPKSRKQRIGHRISYWLGEKAY